MRTKEKLQSRRALFNLGVRSLAGAGLLGSLEGAARASASLATDAGDRALVCVYLFGGEASSKLPAIPELQALEAAGDLRVLDTVSSVIPGGAAPSTPGQLMARKYNSLRFLPNGFATPEWAARLAGIGAVDGAGAFTFRNGMSLVSVDGRLREGSQYENPGLRRAMSEAGTLRTEFPATSLGRQLEDVSRLLRAGGKLGLKHPVFLCTAGGFTSGAERPRNARYRELGRALAAFHAATVELGMERQVTTYTDAEPAVAANGGTGARCVRMILGGAAVSDVEAGHYHASLARWHGVSPGDLPKLFPSGNGVGMLA